MRLRLPIVQTRRKAAVPFFLALLFHTVTPGAGRCLVTTQGHQNQTQCSRPSLGLGRLVSRPVAQAIQHQATPTGITGEKKTSALRRARLQGSEVPISAEPESPLVDSQNNSAAVVAGADARAGAGAAGPEPGALGLLQENPEPREEVECDGISRQLPAKHCRKVRTGTDFVSDGRDSEKENGRAEYRRDPGECWSRKEWGCVFGTRHSRNAPSRELRRALQRYTQRWRACYEQETPFQVLTQLEEGKPTVCRYIMMAPMKMGLGNQVLSVLAALTYALLTDRILYLEPRNNPMLDLFCEPFQNTPPWSLQHRHILGGPEMDAPARFNYSFRINDKVNLSEPVPVVLQFHVHHRVDMQRYFCSRFHLWASNASALLMTSNMWWVPVLMFVPHMRAQLRTLFPANHIFSTLAQLLLRPNNRVWKLTLEGLQKHLDTTQAPGSQPVVGVQFRAAFNLNTSQALNSSAKCIHDRFPSSAIRAPNADSSSASASGPIKVFVASLSKWFRGELAQHLQELGVNASVISLTEDIMQNTADPRHNERALVELLTIALASSTLILTPRSTFGYIMAGFSAADPWFLTAPCIPASPEPCLLIPPPKVSCSVTDGCFDGHRIVQVFTEDPTEPTTFNVGSDFLENGMSLSHNGAILNDQEGPLVTPCADSVWARRDAPYVPYGLLIKTRG